MQVTVRIKLPTARDERGWRVHQRWQLTGDVWAFAGSGLQSRQRGRVVPGGNASDEVEASSFRFSDVDLERETTHANADARSL
jgi:hypothetical protein